MKVLITGVAGFIGSTLAKKLIKQGYEVIGIDNINDYYSVELKEDRLKSIGKDHFTFYKTDLEDYEKVNQILKMKTRGCSQFSCPSGRKI